MVAAEDPGIAWRGEGGGRMDSGVMVVEVRSWEEPKM